MVHNIIMMRMRILIINKHSVCNGIIVGGETLDIVLLQIRWPTLNHVCVVVTI